MKTYECLDNYNNNIEGFYSNKNFSYYEFTVSAINDTNDTFNNIDEYLEENNCKLQLAYTDTTIDLNNYEEPISPFLDSLFIQINPTLYVKKNVYFRNQYFYNDNSLLEVLDSDE